VSIVYTLEGRSGPSDGVYPVSDRADWVAWEEAS
jgi:hypothetical protein